MAATTTGQTEAIRWLVGKGADIDKVSQLEYGGRTALVSAAEVGAVESARTLLELGANPHLKMKDGSTALSHALASSMKNDELIELIKAALAKPPPAKAKAARSADSATGAASLAGDPQPSLPAAAEQRRRPRARSQGRLDPGPRPPTRQAVGGCTWATRVGAGDSRGRSFCCFWSWP